MSDQQQVRTGGIENQLDRVGIFYLIVSIIGLIACIILSQDETIKQTGLSSFWIGLGIGVIAQGIIFWILFKAGAEIIRLLKKLNNLPFGGQISQVTNEEDLEYSCSICGSAVEQNSKYCTECGAKLDEEVQA